MKKIYDQLYYIYEKEKLDFFTKYVMREKIYEKEDLLILKKDLIDIVNRLEDFYNVLNEKYNFMVFDEEMYDDYFDYLYGNEGLYYSDLYLEFIKDAKKRIELIKFVLKEEITEETKEWLFDEEINLKYLLGDKKDGWFSYNESAHKIIGYVDSAFKISEIEARTRKRVDINFVKSFILESDNMFLNSREGILFFDEGCNNLVDEFLKSINKTRYYEIEFEENDTECSMMLLDELYDDISNDLGPEIIVVIKNIDNCIFDEKLDEKMLIFLSKTKVMSGINYLFTSVNPYCLETYEKLANITINISEENCYYMI